MAPINWNNMKKITFSIFIPEKESVKDLAKVTAGLAKEVEEVNQYPAVMYRPTAGATKI